MSRKSQGKGGGYVFKRGNNYYLQYSLNGQRFTKSLKTSQRPIAEKTAEDILGASRGLSTKEEVLLRVASIRKLVDPCNVKLLDAFNAFVNAHDRPDCSPGTLKFYAAAFNNFLKFCSEKELVINLFAEVNPAVARGFADYLWSRRSLSERTFNAYIKAMYLIFRIVNPDAPNPFDKRVIARKREKQQGRKKFEPREIDLILNSFATEKFSCVDQPEMCVLFHLGALTGLRLIDACMLKWESVDLEARYISCVPQKTRRINRKAIIPIHKKLVGELQKALSWKTDQFVLPKIAGTYSTRPDVIRHETMAILRQLGFETTREAGEGIQRRRPVCRFGFHSFRHSFASLMASNGYSITMLAKILADDTRTLEKYYIDIDPSTIVDTFDRMLGSNQEYIAPQLPQPSDEKSKLVQQICSALMELPENKLNSFYTLIKKD